MSGDPGRAAGIVLAGGRSTRMGRPKAGLAWEGTTLLGAVVTALAPVVARVIVVRAPGQELPALPAGILVTEDQVAGRGPLEGIRAGMSAAGDHPRVVVAAVDLPFLGPALVARLLAALTGDADAAVPVVGGRPQPLLAAYRTVLLPEVARLLDAGERRAGALLEGRRVAWLDEAALRDDPAVRAADPGLAGVRDVDTPQDYRAAQSSRDTGTGAPAATPAPSSGSQASTRAPASEVIA
jgi:molybdopterin-guanine dinucleotide biosynthesis protein A